MAETMPTGTTRPPRFRLRAEAAEWRPPRPPNAGGSGPAGEDVSSPLLQHWGRGHGASPIWIPAARLISLRAHAGETARCLVVLERREGEWTEPERQMVSATFGTLRAAENSLDAVLNIGNPELARSNLLLPLSVAVSDNAVPGRYKGPMEVRCGRRIEPLAAMIEVLAAST